MIVKEQFTTYFSIFKYWINLNGQAKVVIALLSAIIMFLAYRNHQLSSDIETQRVKYDKLQKEFVEVKDKVNVDNRLLYNEFEKKLDDSRTKRDKEINDLLQEYKNKVEKLENKVENYEKNRK